MAVFVTRNIPRGDHDCVNRGGDSMQLPVNPGHQIESVASLLVDEQVEIAEGIHVAAGRAAAEDDLLRIGYFDNAPDDLVQRVLIKHFLTHNWRVSPCSGGDLFPCSWPDKVYDSPCLLLTFLEILLSPDLLRQV